MRKVLDIISEALPIFCLICFIILMIANIVQKQYNTAEAWFCAIVWLLIAEVNRR